MTANMRLMELPSLTPDLWSHQNIVRDLPKMPTKPMPLGLEPGVALLCYGLWPESVDGRNELLVTLGTIALENLDKLHSEGSDLDAWAYVNYKQARATMEDYPSYREIIRQEVFENWGGMSAVVRLAYSEQPFLKRVEKQLQSLRIAGQVLMNVYRMNRFHRDILRGGPSVAKAVRLFERRGGLARSKVLEHWQSHKSVAHIGAALNVIYAEVMLGLADGDIAPHPVEVQAYLAPASLVLSKYFERFGLEFVAHRSTTGPLLDPERIWRLPVEVPFIESIYGGVPLAESELKMVT